MIEKNGGTTERSPVALLLIDVINDMQFPGGTALARQAMPMSARIAALKRRAKTAGVAVIYVNDNFGKWRSDFRRLVERCTTTDVPGRPIATRLKPTTRDYFVLKPHQSGFFSTTLDTLLRRLGTHTVVLTGIAGNMCLLFTAHDAYMRDLRILVPRDCTVSESPDDNEAALAHMRLVLKADTRESAKIDFRKLKRRSASQRSDVGQAGRRVDRA